MKKLILEKYYLFEMVFIIFDISTNRKLSTTARMMTNKKQRISPLYDMAAHTITETGFLDFETNFTSFGVVCKIFERILTIWWLKVPSTVKISISTRLRFFNVWFIVFSKLIWVFELSYALLHEITFQTFIA